MEPDYVLYIVLPHIRPPLADFGRIRRVSRHLAALPVDIAARREIHAGTATLVSVTARFNNIVLQNGRHRSYLPKFRPSPTWYAPALFVEYGNVLYCAAPEHIYLLRALKYRILTAFTEENANGRLVGSRLFTAFSRHCGSVVAALDRGNNIVIGPDGLYDAPDILSNIFAGVNCTHVSFFCPKSILTTQK